MKRHVWTVRFRFWAFALILSLPLVSCGMDSASESLGGDTAPDYDWDASDGDMPDGDDPGDSLVDGDAADGDDLAPERETVLDVRRPVTSNDYLFVINPATGNLVTIHSDSLEIRTFPAGSNPVAIQVLPGTNTALVIDRASDRLVMAQPDDNRTASWPLDPDKQAGYNMISCAPDGRFAVVYYNSRLRTSSNQPVGSIQGVGLVDMRSPATLDERATPIQSLRVGLNPTAVHWKDDSTRAFVVTDQGVTIIDLSDADEPDVTPNVRLEEASGPSRDREVIITRDGRFALVRRIERAELRMVDLTQGTVSVLDLPTPATDLDLLPDDSRAIVTLRESNTLLVVPVPEGFADSESVISHEIPAGVGVAEPATDNNTIALFSTLQNSRSVWIFRLDDQSLTGYDLIKQVRGVAFAPADRDGVLRLLVLHARNTGSSQFDDEYYNTIDRSHGYSILDLASEMVVLQLTKAEPGAFSFTGDGAKGYMILSGLGIRQAQIMDLRASGGARVIEMELSSAPTSLGLMRDEQHAYIAQDHPDGRITFLDTATDESITITGFELNSQID